MSDKKTLLLHINLRTKDLTSLGSVGTVNQNRIICTPQLEDLLGLRLHSKDTVLVEFTPTSCEYTSDKRDSKVPILLTSVVNRGYVFLMQVKKPLVSGLPWARVFWWPEFITILQLGTRPSAFEVRVLKREAATKGRPSRARRVSHA